MESDRSEEHQKRLDYIEKFYSQGSRSLLQIKSGVRRLINLNGTKATMKLVRMRYSDSPWIKVEFQLLIPGLPGIFHRVHLAFLGKRSEMRKVKTRDDTKREAVLKELRRAADRIKEEILFTVANNNGIQTRTVDEIVRQECLNE